MRAHFRFFSSLSWFILMVYLLTVFASCGLLTWMLVCRSTPLHSPDLSLSYLSCFHYLMFMIARVMTVVMLCCVWAICFEWHSDASLAGKLANLPSLKQMLHYAANSHIHTNIHHPQNCSHLPICAHISCQWVFVTESRRLQLSFNSSAHSRIFMKALNKLQVVYQHI